jgi:hypothetical protein
MLNLAARTEISDARAGIALVDSLLLTLTESAPWELADIQEYRKLFLRADAERRQHLAYRLAKFHLFFRSEYA